MGVKNLWGVLSSTGQLVAVGSPGDPIKGSVQASTSKNTNLPSPKAYHKQTNEVLSPGDDLHLSMSALHLRDDSDEGSSFNAMKISTHDIGQAFSGQAVAIDLSCWVCDSQANSNMHAVTGPHLRNLVFRTWSLLSVGVLPVFVVEGNAPELKQATMQARNAQRVGTSYKSGVKNRATRRRFNSVLKECCELFELLGVPWVQAEGEAEATCAALLYNKKVHGIISEDSDVLLYGGDNVLRNFSVQANRPTAEIYTLSGIETKLHLPRDCLVVLSLLLGCDYLPAGVTGVGVSSAIKLLSHWGQTGVRAIERFKSWALISGDLNAPVAKFKKNGDIHALEAAIRDRAVRTEGFPFADVVHEFTTQLTLPQGGALSRLRWKQPNYSGFLSWCERKLGWEPNYSTEKASLFCARWVACHGPSPEAVSRCALQASRIVKACTRGGVASYEVEWRYGRSCVREGRDGAVEEVAVVTTIEPQQMIQFAASSLVKHFEEEKATKKKGKKQKKNVASDKTVKRQSKKTDTKKSRESSKQLKLTACFTSSGSSLALAKGSVSGVDVGSMASENRLDFFDDNLGPPSASGPEQQLPHACHSLQSRTKKKIRDELGTNVLDSRNGTQTDMNMKRNGVGTKKSGSKYKGDTSRLNTNSPPPSSSIEVVNLDDSDDLPSPRPPCLNDSLLNFESFEDVKCDSSFVLDDSENDVSFIVDRFINLNVDQRKELREHQPVVLNGSPYEKSITIRNRKCNEEAKLKESNKECGNFNNHESRSLLSLRERAKLHVDRKQKHLLSPILPQKQELTKNMVPLTNQCDNRRSVNTERATSNVIVSEKVYGKKIGNSKYENSEKKPATTDSGYCDDRSLEEGHGSLSKCNPIQGGSSLDDSASTLHHNSSDNRHLSRSSTTKNRSVQSDNKKSSQVGDINDSRCSERVEILTIGHKEADSTSLSDGAQTLINISPAIEGKACDRSMDLFDDTLSSENSYCCPTDNPPQITLQPEVLSQNQGTDMPCFKLLDSFWMDSASFLCTPSPSKRTYFAPRVIPENKSAHVACSSTSARIPHQNISDRGSNIQHNTSIFSSQPLDDERLIDRLNLSDNENSYNVQPNVSGESGLLDKITQNPNSSPSSRLAVCSSNASVSPSSSSFSLSPCVQQLSLADRMKVKYGKKTVDTLLPHTKL